MQTITSSNTNGANVSYTYDDLDRLSTVVDNRLSGNNTTEYTYDPASNLATAKYPNGLQSSFTYDTLNRLTEMNAGTASYSYQLGDSGNRTQATESNGRTINWTYDGIYRLTNEAIADDPGHVNGSVAYNLDPVGNRLSDSSSLAGINSGSFGYNADDEVSTETYDNNGNTLTTGGKSFTYDSENHLISMTASGTTVYLAYDAFGNRVAKTVNGVTTRYLVEDDVNPTGYPQVMDELTGGVVTRTYTYGLQRISQDQAQQQSAAPHISKRDKAYLDKYYKPMSAKAKEYGVNPALPLGLGIESGFATKGTYLRTGDAFGMTGGSTKHMTKASSPEQNVDELFSTFGERMRGTGSNTSLFLNHLEMEDANGNQITSQGMYNSIEIPPTAWKSFITSGINEMQRDIPIYNSQ